MRCEAGRYSASHFPRHRVTLDLRRLRGGAEVNSLAKRGYVASYKLIAMVEIDA